MSQRSLVWALPLLAFCLYLHTAGPTLVPYRDAGEMSTSVPLLGVLHPPAYPTYSLIGHLASKVPLGNRAYRLNVFSALSLALAWAFLLSILIRLTGTAPAVLTLALAAISFQFWRHGLVAEMYAFNLTVLAALLWLVQRQQLLLAGLVFGLGLGVRLDLLLCVPSLLWLLWDETPPERRKVLLLGSVGCAAFGLSIFLYVYLRARGQPLINWGDASTLERFWAVLTRRSYGSGLDLLAESYRFGENFYGQFLLYLRHLARDFSLLSFPLIAIGWLWLSRYRRPWFGVTFVGWLLTGPLFILLGNLPTNPHAVAIMEAAYLVPDLFLLIAMAGGLMALRPYRLPYAVAVVLLVCVTAMQASRTYPQANQRQDYVADDFVRNIYHSVPEPALIIARSDVPTFALFYGHWIAPAATWKVPIAQGLAGSAWYQWMMERQTARLDLEGVRTVEDWTNLARKNSGWSLYATQDAETSPELQARMAPNGLLSQFMQPGKASLFASDTLLRDFSVYRGRYRYAGYREFFVPELIEHYAKAWMSWGRFLMNNGRIPEAMQAFRQALVFKSDLPYAAFQLGYLYFSQSDWAKAEYYYAWANDNFAEMAGQAKSWKSFPLLQHGISQDRAQALAHSGVIQERLGRPEAAIGFYGRALRVDPQCADARYNLAVMYWRAGKWSAVVEQLEAMASAHPADPRWRVYLPKALEKLKERP
jgi:tetratricopeptide (TPR) repeat protein